MNTLVKHNGHYPTLVRGIFGKDLMDDFFAPAFGGSSPAVNVIENEEGYRIELAAPGLHKTDFKVNLDRNRLSIAAQKKNEEGDTNKYTRREFSYASFQRSFTLPSTVDGEKINATYTDGILSIDLPKREEAKVKPNRTIEIS